MHAIARRVPASVGGFHRHKLQIIPRLWKTGLGTHRREALLFTIGSIKEGTHPCSNPFVTHLSQICNQLLPRVRKPGEPTLTSLSTGSVRHPTAYAPGHKTGYRVSDAQAIADAKAQCVSVASVLWRQSLLR